MSAKLDNDGFLLVNRFGKYERQFCPIDAIRTDCGTWCPHFLMFQSDVTAGLGIKVKLNCFKTEYILDKIGDKE